MIDVLFAGVDEVLAAAAHCASAEDRRTAGMRTRADLQRRTLAGRAGLRLLAAWRHGVPRAEASEIEISRSCPDCTEPHGRPVSDQVALSSSTSGAHVLIAVADPADAIGADIEAVPQRVWEQFDEYALHEHEQSALPALETQAGVAARIEAWTAKEAALKVSGRGLRAAPAAIRIDSHAEPEWPGWFRAHGAPGDGSHRSRVWVRRISASGDLRAAIATDRPQEVRLRGLSELLR